ncbi:hypothetical protein KUF71_010752 [Frankliniella fusca]|uniref:ATP-dependent DNA helicase n=1 Tax=Frankliniella fusca TaxID=407009 RepID=A0AAE1HHQ5_9NEOP|nr:hypothetical protein KUF71_010752 [Frankliniella fusca]
MFKSRELSSLNIPNNITMPDAIAIAYTNAKVDDYNNDCLSKDFQEGCDVLAIDILDSSNKCQLTKSELRYFNSKSYQKTEGLPLTFKARIGALYMLTCNIDVIDGLANGACGTLKKIIMGETSKHEKVPLRIYLSFSNTNIGHSNRATYTNFFIKDKANREWVMLERIVKTMTISKGSTKVISRKQFPLTPAQAITSYKSQSSTYEKIIVFPEKMTRRHLYTSFSRVPSLNKLFISGIYKPPPPPTQFDISQDVIKKMKTDNSLQFNINFPSYKTKPYGVFHNIRSLNLYLSYVISHPLYNNAEILIFAETRFQTGETHNIPNYICIHRNDCFQQNRHAYGTAVYIKETLKLDVSIDCTYVDNIHSGNSLKAFIDIGAVKFKNTIIIFLHKSPNYPYAKFKQVLMEIVTRYTSNHTLSVLGDFNLNPAKISPFMEQYNLRLNLQGDYSTDYYTLIDLCYSNNTEYFAQFYESPISDHKPLYFDIIYS